MQKYALFLEYSATVFFSVVVAKDNMIRLINDYFIHVFFQCLFITSQGPVSGST